ncbi:MAG: hypothetical protein RIB98_19580 [Acidimicrobiales bacterium]
MLRRLLFLVYAAGVFLGGCSVEDGPVGERAPTTTPTTSTAGATDLTAPTTSVGLTSVARIEIGPATYELDALCAAGGAGEVEVAVEGVDVNGRRVIGLIRAYLGEPYIGLQVGEGANAVLFEPRLEGVLPFELVDDVLEFEEVDFVTALDLETGEFTPAGLGTVVVECRSFVRELPAVIFD